MATFRFVLYGKWRKTTHEQPKHPAQVKPTYPTPYPAPGRTRDSRRARDSHQVRPAYPVPPPARENPASGPPFSLSLSRTPNAFPSRGTCIGEIEAKDGLPSADRNNKATLLLTGPFRTAKSSAKDLTPLVLKLQYAKYHNHSSVAVEESPAETLSRSLFLSICTCGWYHRVLAWILT